MRGIEALKSGADASAVITHSLQDTATPLMVLLEILRWKIPNHKGTLEGILENLQMWADMLLQAGRDLCECGAREEAEIWNSLQKVERSDSARYSPEQSMTVERLLFGPTPADWTLEVRPRGWSFWFCELRNPPGSFPLESRVPTRIIWRPTASEMEEGCWVPVPNCTVSTGVPGERMTLQRAIEVARFKEQQHCPVIEPVYFAFYPQDDAGVIALMQYRAGRASQPWRKVSPRSHSQPPGLRGRESRIYEDHFLRTDQWLPRWHLCPFDSKFTFESRQFDFQYSQKDLRNCIQGKTDRPASAQESTEWQDSSFLALIAKCQNNIPTIELRTNGHTGRPDCPQKCRTVKLEQLHVPKRLKPYHPRPSWKPTDLSDN